MKSLVGPSKNNASSSKQTKLSVSTCCWAAASMLFLGGTAQAGIFLNEHFDSYADQTAFQATWAPNTTTALLSTEQSVSLNQSVKAGTGTTRNALGIGEVGFQ